MKVLLLFDKLKQAKTKNNRWRRRRQQQDASCVVVNNKKTKYVTRRC